MLLVLLAMLFMQHHISVIAQKSQLHPDHDTPGSYPLTGRAGDPRPSHDNIFALINSNFGAKNDDYLPELIAAGGELKKSPFDYTSHHFGAKHHAPGKMFGHFVKKYVLKPLLQKIAAA